MEIRYAVFRNTLKFLVEAPMGYYNPDRCYRAEQINFRKKTEQNVLRMRAMEYPKSGPAGPTDPYEFIVRFISGDFRVFLTRCLIFNMSRLM